MYDLGNCDLSCCCTMQLNKTTKNIGHEIDGGENVKYFKYKDNLYYLNEDIKIVEDFKLYKDDKEIPYMPTEEGTYVAKKVYVVKKGYYSIETFETEDEAKKFIEKIQEEVE